MTDTPEPSDEERAAIREGAAAKQALDYLRAHFEGLRAGAVDEWINTPLMDVAKRERLHIVAQTLTAIEAAMFAAVNAGDQAGQVVNYRVMLAEQNLLRPGAR